jgi:predicted amidophosphoribosyltransferase
MDWRALLDFVFPAQCASCNAIGAGLCNACRPDGKAVAVYLPSLRVAAVAAYEGSLRAAVLALKDGRRDVAEALGRITAPLVPSGATLVPVPTTVKRRRVRGLDGVALVALDQRSGDAQRGRSRVQRLAAQGRFACNAAGVAGRRVTLFDDVCTTGSTLRDCADAIREAGGVVDDAIVVAVAKRPNPWSNSIAR